MDENLSAAVKEAFVRLHAEVRAAGRRRGGGAGRGCGAARPRAAGSKAGHCAARPLPTCLPSRLPQTLLLQGLLCRDSRRSTGSAL